MTDEEEEEEDGFSGSGHGGPHSDRRHHLAAMARLSLACSAGESEGGSSTDGGERDGKEGEGGGGVGEVEGSEGSQTEAMVEWD
ncbi:MAG: hypothetical protein WDW38_001683 [Sanguina aurantia]